jgi:acetoin:2,6-dichlorophenolindophenol oxidoreductase subunit beta
VSTTTDAKTTLTYAAALDEAVAAEMRDDRDIFMMCTSVPAPMVAEFGPERVRATPISEPGMTGLAIGAAAAGKRPVVNWRNITFAMNSFDQVVNQAAKIRYMFGGQRAFPIVFRAVCGGGQRLAAQHSQSPYSIFAHVPGLKVIVPSSPADAYGLMRAAIRDDNPVICFEPGRLAGLEGEVDTELKLELGAAAIKRPGTDVTLVAIGYMVVIAEQVADALAEEGISVEIIDPRSVSPLDMDTIKASVLRTGRLVVADEAPAMCSMASEIAAAAAEDAQTFAALRTPPVRVSARATPVPFGGPMEDFVLPGDDDVTAGIRKALGS